MRRFDFRILPLALRGSISGNSRMCTGTLNAASRSRTKSCNSASVACMPGLRLATAAGSSPSVLWARPTTAASITAGCSYSALSTSMQ
ncbi:hypothetical protein D3C72_2410360 [compost metagenome]